MYYNSVAILVVIESITFTIFLIFAIIALNYLIKVLQTVKRLTDKAELITDKAEDVVDTISKAAGPMAVGRVITHLADSVLRRSKKGKETDYE